MSCTVAVMRCLIRRYLKTKTGLLKFHVLIVGNLEARIIVLKQKQKPKETADNKHEQIPESVPVLDNSDILDKLSTVTQDEEGTDFEAMDDGSSLDDGGGACGCW